MADQSQGAWTEDDFRTPWGCEVAFLRYLAYDQALNVEQAAMLRHCANRIEATAAITTHDQAPAAEISLQLEWSPTLGNGKRMSYVHAEKAIAALGDGWRMPTVQELLSIVDYTRCDPAIDIERFPDTQSGAYWSSTPCVWAPGAAYIVGFAYGLSYSYHLRDDGDAFVRACRALPAGQ